MAGEGVEGEAVAGATAVEETEEVLAVATAGEERVVAQVAAKARVAVPVALKEEAVAAEGGAEEATLVEVRGAVASVEGGPKVVGKMVAVEGAVASWAVVGLALGVMAEVGTEGAMESARLEAEG